jgi:hypothetical protein
LGNFHRRLGKGSPKKAGESLRASLKASTAKKEREFLGIVAGAIFDARAAEERNGLLHDMVAGVRLSQPINR